MSDTRLEGLNQVEIPRGVGFSQDETMLFELGSSVIEEAIDLGRGVFALRDQKCTKVSPCIEKMFLIDYLEGCMGLGPELGHRDTPSFHVTAVSAFCESLAQFIALDLGQPSFQSFLQLPDLLQPSPILHALWRERNAAEARKTIGDGLEAGDRCEWVRLENECAVASHFVPFTSGTFRARCACIWRRNGDERFERT